MRRASIKTLLEYTPYDNKCPSPFGLRDDEDKEEEKFYSNHLFVDYPVACEGFREKISEYIEEQTVHLIAFSGSSGSGKTTFLKNYFRNKNEYLCKYINLVEYPSLLGNDETVATTLKDGLQSMFSPAIAKTFYETYTDWGNQKTKAKVRLDFLSPKERTRFISFCESFSQENSSKRFDDEMEKFRFYQKNDLKQLLSLYLIASIIPYKNDDSPFVFVFDNLDEVDKQYISSSLRNTVNSAYSIAQKYCDNVLKYNFTWNVTFLLSVRMENQRYLRVSDTHERTDILHTNSKSLEFSQEYQAPYSDILNARLLFYEKNCRSGKPKEVTIKNNYDSISKLLHSEDVFFKRFIKPLYSYDYRMFTHFVISDLVQKEMVLIPKSLTMTDAGDDCHQGARGMLLSYSLAGLLEYGMSRFSSYVREETLGDTCNIFRMSFTLLSNLSGWPHGKDELIELLEDKDDFNERTKPVEMRDFLDAIKSWYKDEKTTLIPKVLNGLIGTSANSFECPVLLFGSPIDECVRSLGDGFSVAELASKVVRDYQTNSDSLDSVTIQVNPLCVVYSARVFIHYEYFNLISPYMKEEKGYNPKPLFQYINFDNDEEKENIKKCLSYTFETAKTIIKRADKHFCKICKIRNNDSCLENCDSFVNRFKEDGFSFNNTIHATRIVSAHIHYLDKYRHFLWHRIGNKDNHSDKEIEIQKMIIEQILEYIDFYKERKVRDSLYDTIANFWKEQYEDALESLKTHQQDYKDVNLVIRKV